MKVISNNIEGYFEDLRRGVERCYGVATEARGLGLDPEMSPECPLALSMAEKVVNLVKTVYPKLDVGRVSRRILELEGEFGKLSSGVVFGVAREVSEGRFGDFGGLLENIDCGLRVGFAYLTLGVVVTPIEGFTGIECKSRRVEGCNGIPHKIGGSATPAISRGHLVSKDLVDKEVRGDCFLSVNFSGPVRSAGTTAVCVFLILVDYLRVVFGFGRYDASEDEVERVVLELREYHERVTNLAYFPSEDEVRFLARRVPVMISGEPTERIEVSGFRDLDRVGTNRIRGGMCLAFAEGLALKVGKGWGRTESLRERGEVGDGFGWVPEYLELHKKRESGSRQVEATYIKDIVAGRPVFGHPGRGGGFRFRYGRSRTSGFSSVGIHPAAMGITGGFLSHGVQLRFERPIKAGVVTGCDSVEAPIVRLRDGSVRRVLDYNEGRRLYDSGEVDEVLYLGDVLVSLGDVVDRNADLIKPGYVEEWWGAEVEKVVSEFPHKIKGFSALASLLISRGSLEDESSNFSTQNQGVCDPRFALDFAWEKRDKGGDRELSFEELLGVSEELLGVSEELGVALHPSLIFYWSQISNEEFVGLVRWLDGAVWRDGKLVLNWETSNREKFGLGKRALEKLGVLHDVVLDNVVVSEDARALLLNLGKRDFYNGEVLEFKVDETDSRGVLEVVNDWCDFEVRDKAGSFIGCRMGRPEKAKLRKLTGSPNVLFPVGVQGGRLKSVKEAVEKGFVKSKFGSFVCESCGVTGIFERCECGAVRRRQNFCLGCGEVKDKCKFHDSVVSSWSRKVDVGEYFERAVEKVGEEGSVEMKGVAVLGNDEGFCERLEKGILRSRMGLSVNKDGTVRYDAIEIPLTHFRAREIGVSVDRLRGLGYVRDINGDELVSGSQVLELMPHDVVLPGFGFESKDFSCKTKGSSTHASLLVSCENLGDDKVNRFGFENKKVDYVDAGEVFQRVGDFVDKELSLFYGMSEFYGLRGRDDVVGQLVVCMAPHNCAGVVGRVIGWSRMQGVLASPFMHAAMRRDCDGDECSVMLLMDVLLNFSRKFLPSHRGGSQDAPLVLNARIDAGEVDDQILYFDVAGRYPLELYEAAGRGEHSSVVREFCKMEKSETSTQNQGVFDPRFALDFMSKEGVEEKCLFVGDRLKLGEDVFVGNGFLFDTVDFNVGNNNSVYKSLPSMKEKVDAQMALVERLRGVDEDDVARLILERHFIRDIRGNLRKFCRQEFRCSGCGEKYRRPPLSGVCWKCSGKLIGTVSEGSVKKYLEPALELAGRYNVSEYVKENMELLGDFVERIFGKGDRQERL